ncbi:MAG: HAMP domain-containing protein, partial [Planctomycetes bacterium]|nr:HAMP domain-containing protein [Planctomycetota bacterium]
MSFRVKIVLPIILVMIAVTSLLGVWLSLSFDEARAEERRNVAETLRRHVEDWNRQERARLGRLFELQLAAWLNATGFQQDSYLYLYTDLQKWVQRGYLTAAHIWDGADQYQYSIPSLPVSAETHPAPTDGERAIFARIRRTMQPHVEGLVAYAPVRIVVNPPEQTPPGPRPHGGAGHAGASRSDPAAGEKSAEAGGAGATDRDQPRGPPVEVGTEGAPIYVVRLHMNFTPPTVEDRPIQLAWEKAAGQTIQTTIVVLLAGTLAAVVAVYILLAGQVIRPLEQLAAVARQVGKGDYRTRVPPTRRTDEVGALMTTFGRMVEELDQYKSDMEGKVESATRKFHETQKGLIVAQRLAAMGSLASGIAHEINNPLSGMLNAVRRLTRKSGGRDAQLEAYLELIEDGLLRIQTIVQKLLQFSPRRVARGEVDLANVIERAVALKAYDIERQGLALSRDLAPDLPRVAGDANEVLQVVLNLVINAMDACAETGRGGDITIRAAREGQGEVRIDVADTGCGMNDEQKS